MQSRRSSRARPDIKPIQTQHTGVSGARHRALKALGSPAWVETPVSPATQRPLPVQPELRSERMKPYDRSVVDRLDSSARSPTRESADTQEADRLFSLGFTFAPRRGPLQQPRRRQTIAVDTRLPPTPSGQRSAEGTAPPPLVRRQSAPSGPLDVRYLNFQRFREKLWRQGTAAFGNTSRADAFIMPVELTRSARGVLGSGMDSPALSPFSNHSHYLAIRVIIRSKGRPPVGLRRNFNIDSLRATVPEFVPSPRSPNFTRRMLMPPSTPRTAEPPSPFPASIRSLSPESQRTVHGPTVVSPSPSLMGSPRRTRALPIHLQYARAHLPVIASIMMSDKVRHGDTIELPLPHPSAWTHTVAFVYTGEEEFLSDAVKDNIVYLGGKI